VTYGERRLVLAGKGSGPADCSPLAFNVGDHAYEISAILEPRRGAIGGALLFYSSRGFVGFGFDGSEMYTYNYAQEHGWLRIPARSGRVHVRLVNDHHIVTMYYSLDGDEWRRHPWRFEVSGYHQNVFGGFRSLRPALFAAGGGEVSFADFRYRALP